MRSSGTSFRPFPLCICECIELQSCCVVNEHFSEMSLYLLQLSFSPLLIVFEIILQQDMQAELFLSNYLIFHNLAIRKDDNHVHNEGEDHFIELTFDQLYGGGQGVYGTPTHEGVTVVYNNR